MCPVCEECKSGPNVVDDSCTRCWNCEHDEGILRGDPTKHLEEPEKEVIVIEEKQ